MKNHSEYEQALIVETMHPFSQIRFTDKKNSMFFHIHSNPLSLLYLEFLHFPRFSNDENH
jgi:hypothetical protein